MGIICQLEKENKRLKNDIIPNLKEENKRLNDELNNLKKQINIKESKAEVDAINFYDVIVNIDSIKDIINGWNIKVSENKKYEDMIKDKVLKIGVIGNSNKGKSFILSKISNIELPSGTSIKTEGLSIKYPILEDRKIVLLDSAGLETPVLIENKVDSKLPNLNNEKVNDNININNGNININNDNINIKNDYDLFKEKSREKMITELFLQNYIIYNSDILIVVVGLLTYSEQKLLNKIKADIKKGNLNKTLYVIHNLMTYTTKKQVEDYIANTLLNCATFKLEEQIKINMNNIIENGVCFYEKNCKPDIFHLIFANEYSEAGKYYNGYTLKYLINIFGTITNLKCFDIIKTLKERFKEVSKEIIEKFEGEIIFDESKKDIIKLKTPKEMVLRKCFINELGFQLIKRNSFEPAYNYYIENDKIIIKVEAPGNCNIESNIEYNGEYEIIKVEGVKEKDNEPSKITNNLYNCREAGKIYLEIPIKCEDFLIKNEKPIIEKKNGIFIISYKLDERNKKGVYKQREEDRI